MNQLVFLERENKQLKEQQQESIRLLKACIPHLGMTLGEELNAHVAELQGSYFNAKDYHYEKPVGEQ